MSKTTETRHVVADLLWEALRKSRETREEQSLEVSLTLPGTLVRDEAFADEVSRLARLVALTPPSAEYGAYLRGFVEGNAPENISCASHFVLEALALGISDREAPRAVRTSEEFERNWADRHPKA